MARTKKHRNTEQNVPRHPLLVALLVVMESVLSIALRFDKRLRQLIFPLVEKNMVWCVRTYLPHVIVYVSFTSKGVLLDSKKPEHLDEDDKADVIISASLMAIIKTLVSSDDHSVKKLQFRGSANDVALSQEVFGGLGMQRLVANTLSNIRRFGSIDDIENQQTALQFYKKRATEQEATIESLHQEIENIQLAQDKMQKRHTGVILLAALFACISASLVAANYF